MESIGDVIERVKVRVAAYPQPQERVEVPKKSHPMIEYCGVGIRHQQCSFENYTGNDRLVETLRNEKENSIVLSGKTGCGKTHLAVSILREAGIYDFLHGAFFITAPEMLLKIRTAFSPTATESEEEIIKKFAGFELLVLDDLGAEKTTEYSITTLYLILDRRNRENRRTIVTTNLSLQDVEETLGARIASRLSDMKFIKINMPDHRKNRAA